MTMRLKRIKRSIRYTRLRDAVGITLACLYTLMILGFSFPTSAPVRFFAAAFPCQDHRCGCISAERCWQMCCCLTDAAKLAWAEKNDVTPPSSFLKKLAKHHPAHVGAKTPDVRLQVKLSLSAESKFETCSPGTASSIAPSASLSKCCKASLAVENSGKSEVAAPLVLDVEPKTSSSRKLPPRGVSFIDALGCSGEATSWTLVTQVVPPTPDLKRQMSDLLCEFMPPPADVLLDSPSYSPPEPPPRAV